MGLFDRFKAKKRSTKITADQRASIRTMIEEGFSNEEIRAEFPDIPYYYIKNIRTRLVKPVTETKVSVLAKEFKSLAELESALLDKQAKQRLSIEKELLDRLEQLMPTEEGSTTDDRIVDFFFKEIAPRMIAKQETKPTQPVTPSIQQPQFKIGRSPQEVIAPIGAIKPTDQEIRSVIAEIPKSIVNLIKKGLITKKICLNYALKQGIDKETFERAWKMIK